MEKLLLFQTDDTTSRKIAMIAGMLHIKTVRIPSTQFHCTIGELLDNPDIKKENPVLNTVPKESLMVMCNLSQVHFEDLLSRLRKNKISVDFKAILTPTNIEWDIPTLYKEMYAERDAIRTQTSTHKPN